MPSRLGSSFKVPQANRAPSGDQAGQPKFSKPRAGSGSGISRSTAPVSGSTILATQGVAHSASIETSLPSGDQRGLSDAPGNSRCTFTRKNGPKKPIDQG